MPDNTPLNGRQYPSDPSRRYRQNRVGERDQGTLQNGVWTVTVDATGGFAFVVMRDTQLRTMKNNFTAADLIVNPVGNAAAWQTFLEGQVGVGNVVVTGGPGASGGGTPYVITGAGQLAGQRFFVEVSNALLSGGGTTITAVETTVGGKPDAAVPIGPALSTVHNLPSNSPRGREGETIFP